MTSFINNLKKTKMKEKLEKLGFSPKEADVYISLLELGSAVVSDVAKKAGIVQIIIGV